MGRIQEKRKELAGNQKGRIVGRRKGSENFNPSICIRQKHCQKEEEEMEAYSY
jgi:hypothetical protein